MEHAGVCAGGRPSGVIREGRFLPRPEGLASHGGPEPCGGGRKGVVEALARGTCRQAIEPRNNTRSGRRHRCVKWKATPSVAIARAASGPRGVEEPCMHGTFMREKCAVRRFVVSPAQPGGTWRVVPGQLAYPAAKAQGDKSMPEKRMAVWRRPGRRAARPARYGQS